MLLGVALVVIGPAAAQAPRLPAQRLSTPPVIDGVLDEPVWEEASAVEGFTDISTGRKPADGTRVLIGYDAEAIFIAFQASDSQPQGIVAREIQPGAEFKGEDTFDFTIDPFNTRTATLSRFRVNALGTQSESVSGGRAAKREWVGAWQAAVRRTEAGWEGEIRIPWSMLNLPGGGRADMALNFRRYQERTKVTSEWANLTFARRSELNGVWEAVQLPPRRSRPRIELLGYVAPEVEERSSEFRSGLDARYKLNEQVTALGSLNPDFRNIEQQIAGIEFTRTERYLSDARPFFAEGSGFYNLTGEYTFARMFYSRRIENFDWGAKVFGRMNPSLSAGALVAVDSGDRTDVVARTQYNFGPHASVSAYGTGRLEKGRDDSGHGFNLWKRWGNYSADLQLAGHSRTGRPNSSAGATNLSYSVPHVFVTGRYMWIEPDFRPALAYVPFRDRKGQYLFAELNKEWRRGAVTAYYADAFWSSYDHYDGSLDERNFVVGNKVSFRNDTSLGVWLSRERYGNEIHDIRYVDLGINGNNRHRSLRVGYEWGHRGGVDNRFLSVGGSYRAFGKLDLGLSQSVLELGGLDRQTIVTVGWEIDRVRSLTGRLVERNGKQNAYAAYRSAGFAGLEVFVIVGDPNADQFRRRLALKLVSAF